MITPLDPEAVAADLRPPPLADLARRARRRTRRRRVTGAAAVLATIATAAAVTLTALPGTGRQDSPATTDPPPGIAGTPIVFSSRTALWLVQTGCGITIQLTLDAGRSWTEPGGPPPLDDCTPGMSPMLSYSIVGPRQFRVSIDDQVWFTGDAGRTWTNPPTDERLADSFLPGTPGFPLGCDGGCDRPRSIDPASGQWVVSRTDLPFPGLQQAFYADLNTIWVVGTPGRDQPMRAAYSDDLGRTWSAPVDLPTTDRWATLVATGPRRAYLLSRPQDRAATAHRTDDGGQTWTEIDLPADDILTLTENKQGQVVVAGSAIGPRADAWVSTDSGATFTGPTSVDVPAPIRGAVGGPGLVWAAGGDNLVQVNDGSGWQVIRPPA